MVKQSEVTIGTAGHVDHGKTSIIKALTGEWVSKYSEELERGITIKLGYTEMIVYECEKCGKILKKEECECGGPVSEKRRIAFLDCPGHESLTTVMLSGATLMDGALLVIAANEPVPQPQTLEHLLALNAAGIKNIIIIQNKIDLVSEKEARENYLQIKNFVKNTVAENAPIIPIAAHQEVNIDALLYAIEKYIPTPKRDLEATPKMYIARSFDVNKPGEKIEKLKGGVIGGSLVCGKIKVGDRIQILPGIEQKDGYSPIKTKVTSISCKWGMLEEAVPGGLIGLGTTLEPALTKNDYLSGNLVCFDGVQVNIEKDITMEVHNLIPETEQLKKGETIVVTCATITSIGTVQEIKKDKVRVLLKKPVPAEKGQKLGIIRRLKNRWSLFGYGIKC
ncbi:MAG: translation initiation factor IF-2 subunit gamma [archaeon]